MPEWFMRLIRHEAAHPTSYAIPASRKKMAGNPSADFERGDTTPPFSPPPPVSDPMSCILTIGYAQSSREDFAETLCVWLPPAGLARALQGLEGVCRS